MRNACPNIEDARCLKVNVSPDFAVDIFKACVVLHNFARERDGYKFEDVLTVTGVEDMPDGQSVRGGVNSEQCEE